MVQPPQFPPESVLDYLLKRYHTFMDVSNLDKCRLSPSNGAMGYGGEASRIGFGDKFKDYVNKHSCPKLLNVHCPLTRVSTLE
jgi:hypothetical protein